MFCESGRAKQKYFVCSPVKESEQSARHPRLSTKDGESVLLEDTATRPEEQRKQGESSGTASAFNDHHQAIHPLVQNVLLLTNALQGMKERIGKVEIAAASALEKMAGHVCVLESRVRMLEHMVGAQVCRHGSPGAVFL